MTPQSTQDFIRAIPIYAQDTGDPTFRSPAEVEVRQTALLREQAAQLLAYLATLFTRAKGARQATSDAHP